MEKSQENSEIAALRAKVEAGNMVKYIIHHILLHYLSVRGKEVTLKLVVPKSPNPRAVS